MDFFLLYCYPFILKLYKDKYPATNIYDGIAGLVIEISDDYFHKFKNR